MICFLITIIIALIAICFFMRKKCPSWIFYLLILFLTSLITIKGYEMYEEYKINRDFEKQKEDTQRALNTLNALHLDLTKKGVIGTWKVKMFCLNDEIVEGMLHIKNDDSGYHSLFVYSDGEERNLDLTLDYKNSTFYVKDSEYGEYYKIKGKELIIGYNYGLDDSETTYIEPF